MEPGEQLTLSVFLEEYMTNQMLDTNPYAGMHRFWDRYHNNLTAFTVRTSVSDMFQNKYELSQSFTVPSADSSFDVTIVAPPIATPTG